MDSLFEYRSCPSCGEKDCVVLFESNMKESDFNEEITTVYMLPGDKYGRHVKCRNCGLVYVNPIEGNGRINEDYSQRKNNDADIIRGSRLKAAKSQMQLVEKYSRGTSLLDIGCGEGFFLFNAYRMGYTVKGIELSEEAAEYARREFNIDIETKPFEEAEFRENCFDVVTLWQVLEHVPHPLVILEEVHRILKPGGLVVVSTPDFGGVLAKILRRRWWNIRRLHINQFATGTLNAILENAGFKDISSAYYKECINLTMLIIPVLRYFKIYERLEAFVHPNSVCGKIMSNISLPYSSRLDNCNVIGFK
ncbi:MAG: class I SAM-dependent methyltransferase [Chloroflexota bacterium]|nr:class I SAM-dependent methyltransferase [Chloroflexota bacterium]